ncbi:MAG TPA: TonB-dependent receptor [Longimicrobiales bacterium]|nr:TonB-dependent receptor [Longimicrobiales bacterium]
MKRAVVAILLVTGAGPASAQEPSETTRGDSVFRIEMIRVETARPATTAGGAAAVEVNLDSLHVAPVSTVADVLRGLPLVQVRTNSRGEVQFALRGSGTDTRQAAVLVDGIPLTLGWDARTDLSVIPTTAARTLTLTRGAPSVLYGPNALGGVVTIGVVSTLGPDERPSLELGSGIDHTGGHALSATGTAPLDISGGTLVVRGGAGYRERDALLRAEDVPVTWSGDADELPNSDVRQVDGFLGARYTADGGAWMSLSTFGFDAVRGVLPELHSSEPRLWRYPNVSRVVTGLSGGTGIRNAIAGGTGDLEAAVGVDVGSTDIDSYRTLAYDALDGQEQGDDRTLTLRLLGDHTLGDSGNLSGALTWAEIRHDERIDAGPEVRYRQRLWSAALESTIRIGDVVGLRDARLTVGGVVDGADTPETGGRPEQEALRAWGARVGATAVAADGGLLLHAAASRRARFPALRELYSGALGRFEPNPELEPERLVVGELGATMRLGRAEVQAVGFTHRLSDAVVRVSTSAGNFQRVNRDEMRSYGVELLALIPFGPLQIAADATFQDVELRDPTTPEDEAEPEYQPAFVAGLNVSAPLLAGIGGAVQLRHTGRQYCVNPDVGGNEELAAWTRVDAQLSRGFGVRQGGLLSRGQVTLALDNATDSALYDQCGLPQPGRTLRLQLRLF